MSKSQLRVARRVVSTLTATATAITMLGSAAIGLAVAPADFGLLEGDTISANAQAGDPDVYIVNEHGFKRLFVNPAIFGLYGHLSFASVKQVSAATRDAFPTSGLFRNCESGDERVYGLDVISEDVANLRHVNTSGAQAVADDPDFFKKVFCINNNEQGLYGTGPAYNSVLDVPDYNRDGGGTTAPPVAGFDPNGGTQGSIDTIELGSPDQSELMEGQTEEVYATEIKLLDDGPLRLDSVDLWVAEQDAGSHDAKPWSYFEEICLLLDGDELTCMDADSKTDWTDATNGNLDTNTTTSEYRMRFTNVNGVLPSDDTSILSATFRGMNNFDSGDMEGADWDVELGQLRVTDESGLTVNENTGFGSSTTLEDTFEIAAGDMANLEVRDANDEIDSSVIEVSETTDTGWTDLYRMTVEEDGDVGGTIEDIVMTFFTSDTPTDVFKKARLMVGGSRIGSEESVPSTGITTFDNVDQDFDGDDKFDVLVQVQFRDNNAGARYAEGTTASVSATVASWTYDDDNGNDEGDDAVSGTAVSEQHELRSEGVQLAFVSASESKDTEASPDIGTFVLKFTATAFGSDIYVEETCGEDAGDGVDFGQTGSASISSCNVKSAGNQPTGAGFSNFRIIDGSTITLTLTVAATGDDEFAGIQLNGVDWSTTDIAEPLNVFDFNLDDYETDDIFLSGS